MRVAQLPPTPWLLDFVHPPCFLPGCLCLAVPGGSGRVFGRRIDAGVPYGFHFPTDFRSPPLNSPHTEFQTRCAMELRSRSLANKRARQAPPAPPAQPAAPAAAVAAAPPKQGGAPRKRKAAGAGAAPAPKQPRKKEKRKEAGAQEPAQQEEARPPSKRRLKGKEGKQPAEGQQQQQPQQRKEPAPGVPAPPAEAAAAAAAPPASNPGGGGAGGGAPPHPPGPGMSSHDDEVRACCCCLWRGGWGHAACTPPCAIGRAHACKPCAHSHTRTQDDMDGMGGGGAST